MFRREEVKFVRVVDADVLIQYDMIMPPESGANIWYDMFASGLLLVRDYNLRDPLHLLDFEKEFVFE